MRQLLLVTFFTIIMTSPIGAEDFETRMNIYKLKYPEAHKEMIEEFEGYLKSILEHKSTKAKLKQLDKAYSKTDEMLIIGLEVRDYCETLIGDNRGYLEFCRAYENIYIKSSAKSKLNLAETYVLLDKDKAITIYKDIMNTYNETPYLLYFKKAELALKGIDDLLEKE